jgi:hypothetical protein
MALLYRKDEVNYPHFIFVAVIYEKPQFGTTCVTPKKNKIKV